MTFFSKIAFTIEFFHKCEKIDEIEATTTSSNVNEHQKSKFHGIASGDEVERACGRPTGVNYAG